MEKQFDSSAVPLAQLLREAASGEVQLPDFQRDWVWDDHHIRSLLASISLSYPIGAMMTLKTGNADVRFAPRPIRGADVPKGQEPGLLLLDGQQRLTSLFLALWSQKAVQTKNTKGQPIERHYYVSIAACLDEDKDRAEEAILSVPADRVVRTDFGKQVVLDLSSRKKEIEAEMFPLGIVLDGSATMAWQMEYLHPGPRYTERYERWMRFHQGILKAFQDYQVPIIGLVKSTRKEAVCQVFEKVNTGGVTLTVFELMTATYAADDYPLRDKWRARKQDLERHRVLESFDETSFLQLVTLLATFDRRRRHLNEYPDQDRAPAVSCKRRDILRLPVGDYRKWADTASEGLEKAASFLRELCVFQSRDLPYATQVIPLAAILGVLGKRGEAYDARQSLKRWFWCGVFGEMYGGGTETRFANDLQDCVAWIQDSGDEPRTVRDAQLQAERLLRLTTRNSAAYKGLHALQMCRGSRDVLSGATIDHKVFHDDAIDIHHIFPSDWCQRQDDERIRKFADTAVNKTAIGRYANRVIGSNAPSRYSERLESKGGMSSQELDDILRSHAIDPIALRRDDFASFFNHRFERLLAGIEEVMGKPVNRSEKQDESPFYEGDDGNEVADIESLVRSGESGTVEFKATGRKNTITGVKDKRMEWAVVKTICAFMNGSGGTLLIGVTDETSIVGIEEDYAFVTPRNRDGWEQWLTALVKTRVGSVAVTDFGVTYADIEGRTVARIDVKRGGKPVFARPMDGSKQEKFFVRLNATTEDLGGSEMLDYQKKRWPSR